MAEMDGVMDNLIKPFPYYQRIRFFWGDIGKHKTGQCFIA